MTDQLQGQTAKIVVRIERADGLVAELTYHQVVEFQTANEDEVIFPSGTHDRAQVVATVFTITGRTVRTDDGRLRRIEILHTPDDESRVAATATNSPREERTR